MENKEEKKNIVYAHKRLFDKQIFYIGVGVNEERAYNFMNRSDFWNKEALKHGVLVEILHQNLIREEAYLLERFYIAKIGRRDLGLGPLVNHTDGGDGTIGLTPWNKGMKGVYGTVRKGVKTGMSSPKKGVKMKSEQVEKLKEAWKKRSRIPWNKGIKQKDYVKITDTQTANNYSMRMGTL